jgi:ribosome modulation factor
LCTCAQIPFIMHCIDELMFIATERSIVGVGPGASSQRRTRERFSRGFADGGQHGAGQSREFGPERTIVRISCWIGRCTATYRGGEGLVEAATLELDS